VFASFNFLTAGHKLKPNAEQYSSQYFFDYVTLTLPCWQNHMAYYLDKFSGGSWLSKDDKPTLVVFYDDLVLNRAHEMRRMLNFINTVHGAPLVDVEKGVRCGVLPKKDAQFLRKTEVNRQDVFAQHNPRHGESLIRRVCNVNTNAWAASWSKLCLLTDEEKALTTRPPSVPITWAPSAPTSGRPTSTAPIFSSLVSTSVVAYTLLSLWWCSSWLGLRCVCIVRHEGVRLARRKATGSSGTSRMRNPSRVWPHS
jgi:hypothetical protein